MNSPVLAQVVDLISSHGYWFILFAMVIEGPIVTTAAAFAAASGIFNPFVIFFLSIAGDAIGDVFYYGVGKLGRIHLIEKYGVRFGFGPERIEKIEKLLRINTWSTLSAIKIAPGLSSLGLIVTGALNIPFKKYMEICLYITLPRSLLFVVLGYYAGQANAVADKYLHHSQFAFVLAVLAIIFVNWAYQKASQFIAQKIERV
jgi:membrane protein DedA with SNARE-associated domain